MSIARCLGHSTWHRVKILEEFQKYANKDATLDVALDVVLNTTATENKFSILEELHDDAKGSSVKNFLEK